MLSTSLLQDYKQKENDAQEKASQRSKTSRGKAGKSGRITRASGKHMKNVPMGRKSHKRR